MTDRYGLDALQKYAAAVEEFDKRRTRLEEIERDIQENPCASDLVAKFQAELGAFREVDARITSLYDLALHSLDEAYAHTAELRLPPMYLTWANSRQAP